MAERLQQRCQSGTHPGLRMIGNHRISTILYPSSTTIFHVAECIYQVHQYITYQGYFKLTSRELISELISGKTPSSGHGERVRKAPTIKAFWRHPWYLIQGTNRSRTRIYHIKNY